MHYNGAKEDIIGTEIVGKQGLEKLLDEYYKEYEQRDHHAWSGKDLELYASSGQERKNQPDVRWSIDCETKAKEEENAGDLTSSHMHKGHLERGTA